jgi:hypothetical protein
MVLLLVAGCSHGPKIPSRLGDACALPKAPHTTPRERSDLLQRAQQELAKLPRSTVVNHRDAAISRALFELQASGFVLPTNLPEPEASALTAHGTPLGLPSFDTALLHLQDACLR